jgi:rhamnogalacturonan endolyase
MQRLMICFLASLLTTDAFAQRQMENLGRGLVAIARPEGKVYLSWRLLGTDAENIGFNVYRTLPGEAATKLNDKPILNSTNFLDAAPPIDKGATYQIRPMIDGKESASSTPHINAPRQYIEIPLKTPPGYAPNDASVGDLDGDGEYEIILHMAGRGRDNSFAGFTDPPILQAYKLDGTLLWTINLGKNIREGAHYTQFMVYDLDGDGIAEIACKTADGTIDGKGKVIGDVNANWINRDGKILDGPEFFTVFDGRTGAALATVNYIPPRGDVSAWGGIGGNSRNDSTGNRVDRFLACVAYLDGVHPSVVMCRGVYGRSVLAAWDWRNGKLTSRWVFDSAAPGNGKDGKPNSAYSGMGGHSITVADVDADGKDEIIYHAMVVDDDGKGLFTTGFRHGDVHHASVLDPSLPGLQLFTIHENEGGPHDATTPAMALTDLLTGKTLWRANDAEDATHGLAADIDPRHAGAEMWSNIGSLRSAKGQELGPRPRTINFAIWWDGDLLRELLDRTSIYKWDWENSRLDTIFTAEGCRWNSGGKATPVLCADLFGDWREEVIFRTIDNNALRIYTTTIPTDHRIHTLMHDPQYRLAIATQNVSYNQPPHPSFFLGQGMKPPPRPNITTRRSSN